MTAAPVPKILSRPLIEFKALAVEWLVPGWLPLGKLAILDGYPGDGKTHVASEVAAALTTGRNLFGGVNERPLVDVLWLSYEEDPHDTIRPRLQAAGADLTRIHLIEGIDRGDGPPEDVNVAHTLLIEEHIKELEFAGSIIQLLVIDPLSLALPEKTDSNNDPSARRALQPLKHLAQRHGVAVLVIRHFTKSEGTKALLKGGGSIGFSAAARAMWAVTDHPTDPECKALAVAKLSNSRKPPARAFRIVGASLPATPNAPHGIETSRVEWGEELAESADDLLAASYEDADRREERKSCGEWLVDFLDKQTGNQAPCEDVAKAARTAGFAERTVRKAAGRAGVLKVRRGFGCGSIYRIVVSPPAFDSARPHSGTGSVPASETSAAMVPVPHFGPVAPP